MKTPTEYGSDNEETTFIRRLAASTTTPPARKSRKTIAAAGAAICLMTAGGIVGYNVTTSNQRTLDASLVEPTQLFTSYLCNDRSAVVDESFGSIDKEHRSIIFYEFDSNHDNHIDLDEYKNFWHIWAAARSEFEEANEVRDAYIHCAPYLFDERVKAYSLKTTKTLISGIVEACEVDVTPCVTEKQRTYKLENSFGIGPLVAELIEDSAPTKRDADHVENAIDNLGDPGSVSKLQDVIEDAPLPPFVQEAVMDAVVGSATIAEITESFKNEGESLTPQEVQEVIGVMSGTVPLEDSIIPGLGAEAGEFMSVVADAVSEVGLESPATDFLEVFAENENVPLSVLSEIVDDHQQDQFEEYQSDLETITDQANDNSYFSEEYTRGGYESLYDSGNYESNGDYGMSSYGSSYDSGNYEPNGDYGMSGYGSSYDSDSWGYDYPDLSGFDISGGRPDLNEEYGNFEYEYYEEAAAGVEEVQEIGEEIGEKIDEQVEEKNDIIIETFEELKESGIIDDEQFDQAQNLADAPEKLSVDDFNDLADEIENVASDAQEEGVELPQEFREYAETIIETQDIIENSGDQEHTLDAMLTVGFDSTSSAEKFQEAAEFLEDHIDVKDLSEEAAELLAETEEINDIIDALDQSEVVPDENLVVYGQVIQGGNIPPEAEEEFVTLAASVPAIEEIAEDYGVSIAEAATELAIEESLQEELAELGISDTVAEETTEILLEIQQAETAEALEDSIEIAKEVVENGDLPPELEDQVEQLISDAEEVYEIVESAPEEVFDEIIEPAIKVSTFEDINSADEIEIAMDVLDENDADLPPAVIEDTETFFEVVEAAEENGEAANALELGTLVVEPDAGGNSVEEVQMFSNILEDIEGLPNEVQEHVEEALDVAEDLAEHSESVSEVVLEDVAVSLPSSDFEGGFSNSFSEFSTSPDDELWLVRKIASQLKGNAEILSLGLNDMEKEIRTCIEAYDAHEAYRRSNESQNNGILQYVYECMKQKH